MKKLIKFIKQIYLYRSMIKAMAVREIQRRYMGTFAGMLWSVINPLMMVCIYWFIFSVGFKVQFIKGVPFIVMYVCALLPWLMFSETLSGSISSITANANLIKKTVFPTEILPVVNLVVAVINHTIIMVIFVVLLLMNNISLTLVNLQVLYYFSALMIFGLGFAWFLSAINVFFRDVSQIVNVILNMWFWLTPIVWDIDILPAKYRHIIMLNPMYYIIEGYKDSFIFHADFWQNYRLGIYFWGIGLLFFVLGGLVFKRLKSDFAEVL